MTEARRPFLAQVFLGGTLLIAGALLAIALMPGFAVAQTEGESSSNRAERTASNGIRLRGGLSGHEAVTITAELTGTTTDEVAAALQAGASLAGYAAEHGVDRDTLTSEIIAATEQRLNERVAEGSITQERADELLAEIDQRTDDLVDREGFRNRGRAGCGQEDGEETTTDTV